MSVFQLTEFLIVFSVTVFSVNGDYYEVNSISSQNPSTANLTFSSSDVENVLQCARKCLGEGCSSFAYNEPEPKECYHGDSTQYAGSQSKTASGETCQRWDSQSPHTHNYINPDKYPDQTLADAANYCRDPHNLRSPFCLTTNPDLRWDFCDIAYCGAESQFTHERCFKDILTSSDYVGTWNKTRTGKVCQRWDAQTPHAHSYTSATTFPDDTVSAAENYCRDPGGSGYTWCYTMETGTKWEACDVFSCKKYKLENRCYNTDETNQYTGSWDLTTDLIKCQPWASQSPHQHIYTADDFPDANLTDASNFCRSPYSGSRTLWCYTMHPNVRWQYCGIYKCPQDYVTCYDGPTVRSYMGTWNKTESGKVCQRWDSQLPHSHTLTADMFEEDTLTDAENFCRDPTGSGKLWCYTIDPEIQKENCGIEKCFPDNGDGKCRLYKDSSLYSELSTGSEHYVMKP